MKKLFFFGALIAAGLSFTACSSDKDVVTENESPEVNISGDKYISVGINLPSVPSSATRANDDFNDGLPAEYDVKDAYLLIFSPIPSGDGKTEDDATFVEWHSIDLKPLSNSSDAQVTKVSRKIVTKVNAGVAAGNLMLVLLNASGNNIVSVSGSTLTVGSTALASQTYKTIREMTISESTLGAPSMTNNGFFMANAILADKAGTSTTAIDAEIKYRTLVPITEVHNSESAAEADAMPDEIYVERGMAKVTVNSLSSSFKMSGTGMTSYDAEILGWTLDNTNTTSYLIRSNDFTDTYGSQTLAYKDLVNQKTGSVYRFVGGTAISEGSPTYKYRTYFSKDPNYSSDATLTAGYSTPANYRSTDLPQYCLENTFDVAHQNENQTTLVRLQVQSKTTSVEDLFELNGTKSTVYTRTTIDSYVKNIAQSLAVSEGWYASSATTDFEAPIYGGADLKDAEITLKVTEAAKANYTSIVESDGVTLNSTALTAIRNAFKSSYGTLAYYADGISYYTIRIKHFGDDPYCNWVNGENGVGTGAIYPGVNSTTDADKVQCAKNWLGRYGVLRNNWYDISISSIKFLGDPAPEVPGTGTDDELDSYITFKINILSWAKRTQSADL